MTVYLQDPDVTLHHGDVLDTLQAMPDGSVDCVVTSPPYWGLRDYGTGAWEGGNPDCDHTTPRSRGDDIREGDKQGTSAGSRPNTQTECRCGATRQDQQLGLEPTPDLFVARMVEVFREIRRVLAPHGTCWINLGDSYTSGGRGEFPSDGADWSRPSRQALGASTRPANPVGLKPKDLVGVPWRVAFALQQPYYTGRIKDERDRVWLAAMVEAEGCMFIHKRKVGQSNGQGYVRKNDSYGSGLEVSSTDREIVERCMEIAGCGSICEQSPEQNQRRKQTIYRWNLRTNECRDIVRELYPHLIAKQHEARLLIGCPSSGEDARKAHESLKAIHQGLTPCIDFAPPEGMWERGWFLRSEIIWAKCRPNPMPESVTDRPTKSHEQIFLLTKQPRYWFDAEAVREPGITGDMRRPYTSNGAKQMDGRPSEQWRGGELRDSAAAGRNVRSVWEIATQPYPEAHFATYPEELVRRCLLAGCPSEVCRVCGRPRERIVDVSYEKGGNGGPSGKIGDAAGMVQSMPERMTKNTQTLGWSDCGHNAYRPGRVLDPFMGSGTTAHVARKHGRHAIGIDLNADYLALAARRLQQLSLFALEAGS